MAGYLNMLKSAFAALAMATLLGCATPPPPQDTGAVQDLIPGEKSVISAPSRPTQTQDGVQERII